MSRIVFDPHPSQPQLQFEYTNWEGKKYTYVITPENIEFSFYPGEADGSGEGEQWQLHGQLVTRDGFSRPEMGDNRRRSFLLKKIEYVKVVS